MKKFITTTNYLGGYIDSALFSKGTEIASLKETGPNYTIKIRLIVCGDTKICFNGAYVKDPSRFPAELTYLIKSNPGKWDGIESSANIKTESIENNWFEYSIEITTPTGNVSDEFVFENDLSKYDTDTLLKSMEEIMTWAKEKYVGSSVLDYIMAHWCLNEDESNNEQKKAGYYLLSRLTDFIVDGVDEEAISSFTKGELSKVRLQEFYETWNCWNSASEVFTCMICDFLGTVMTPQTILNLGKATNEHFETLCSSDVDYLIRNISYEEALSHCSISK